MTRMHVYNDESCDYKIWIKIIIINTTTCAGKLCIFLKCPISLPCMKFHTLITNSLSILIFPQCYNLQFIKSRSIQSMIFPQANY